MSLQLHRGDTFLRSVGGHTLSLVVPCDCGIDFCERGRHWTVGLIRYYWLATGNEPLRHS